MPARPGSSLSPLLPVSSPAVPPSSTSRSRFLQPQHLFILVPYSVVTSANQRAALIAPCRRGPHGTLHRPLCCYHRRARLHRSLRLPSPSPPAPAVFPSPPLLAPPAITSSLTWLQHNNISHPLNVSIYGLHFLLSCGPSLVLAGALFASCLHLHLFYSSFQLFFT